MTHATALLALLALALPTFAAPVPRPALADDYLDIVITYCTYAKSIWHDADVGGYWGGGIAEKDQNGAVRGMCGTMLGYATLVHALDNNWLTPPERKRLDDAALDRPSLLKYIVANLRHICAHHASAPQPLEPKWGFSWQSPLWLGACGPAAALVWNDLPPDLQQDFERLAFTEADRIASKPPKDYRKGDTGAEENGWDSHAPAVALMLAPGHARAADWMKVLKRYAVNTYSTRADRASDERVGTDRLRDIVTTTNLFDDLTLDNHGFFHPDYVQVSAQELGEALLYLEMGDRMHGSKLADEFRPYAMHHVKDVWENVARPLILHTGELAFPNGSDWTVNCSIIPSYLAFIATTLKDEDALRAAMALPKQALRRRDLSPPGRILGETNLVWYWEPILTKRSCTAILQYELRGNPARPPSAAQPLVTSRLLPDSNVWLYRNANYFVSAAWGSRRMGTFTPFGQGNPYWTIPADGILPAEVSEYISEEEGPRRLTIRLNDGKLCRLTCMERSVLWTSPVPLRALSLENDLLSGGQRTIRWADGERTIKAMSGEAPFVTTGNWINIDNRLGMISPSGFTCTPAKGYTMKSAAADKIAPLGDFGAWQMIPNITAEQTAEVAAKFSAKSGGDLIRMQVQDGFQGTVFRFE